MSRVGVLAAAGRSAVAKFHELRLKYWNTDLDVVCCFEGSDDIEFFLPHVRLELGLHNERVDFINCGGKGIVLTLRDWVGQRAWNVARLGFFVDRDLEDFLAANPSGDQLYVTDFYSIESHALEPDFFDRVWQDFFRLPMTDGRRPLWKSAYYSGAAKFAEIMFPIHYTALAYKRAGGGVEFDRIKPGELVAISDLGEVARHPRRTPPSYLVVFVSASPTSAELQAARLTLRRADYRMWLRGKFAIWYSMAFLSRMKRSLGKRTEPNRAVVRASFNEETAITCLSARVCAPSSLRNFLRGWASLIVRDGLLPVGAAT